MGTTNHGAGSLAVEDVDDVKGALAGVRGSTTDAAAGPAEPTRGAHLRTERGRRRGTHCQDQRQKHRGQAHRLQGQLVLKNCTLIKNESCI